ncbi:MAG: glycine cleavage system protein GcvH [Acidimicrobiaceae bacterium]|nr:glycine cleavage system protein GcvH [Acidimicrobiaceae bacterium]
MSAIPDDLRYSEDHLWVRAYSGNNQAEVGITDYAQGSLGDIVSITLPPVGQALSPGEAFGEIESTKSINELISPLDGTVHARNPLLADTPEIVNTDPYGQGWMLQVEVAPPTLSSQLAGLMDLNAYRSLVGD